MVGKLEQQQRQCPKDPKLIGSIIKTILSKNTYTLGSKDMPVKPKTLRRVALVLDIVATVVVTVYVLLAHETLVTNVQWKDGEQAQLRTDHPLIHQLFLGGSLVFYGVAFVLQYWADTLSENLVEAQIRELQKDHPKLKHLHARGILI
jgi:hypothetical protein